MLGVEMFTTIKTLHEKGYSNTAIGKMLGVNRKTVGKILKGDNGDKPVERKKQVTLLDHYKEFIDIQISKELSAKRIFQDIRDQGYEGSYDTVKRYVAKIKVTTAKAYMVLHTLPGEEAQVDFGYIGTIKINEKHKKAWIFIMVLSYSRYMYVQIVFDQTVKTFIECHRNALKYFGGVPETIKIDNLKAGIIQADFYEPTVQRTYAAFAAHYGFWAQPCRVYTPTDKGKVESTVNYVKENCFKGRDFRDYEEAKAFLEDWLKTIANIRTHGTTKKVPIQVFEQEEKQKLQPLPIEDFIFSQSSTCCVNTNCHISYSGNYYSVPYAYIGQDVEAIEMNNTLKVYYKEKEIALHVLCTDRKGEYITNKEHYPHSKNITSEDIMSRQRKDMAEIGDNALMFFENFIKIDGLKKYDYRTISGILSLLKTYEARTIDYACGRALYYNAYSYKVVKRICEKGIIDLPTETNSSYINTETTYVHRELSEYSHLSRMGELTNE